MPAVLDPVSSDLNSQTQLEPDTLNTRSPMQRVVQRTQAAMLQKFTFDSAMSLREELLKGGNLKVSRDDATAIAQLVKAWDTAADRLRVLRGKGLPAAVRSKQSKQIGPVVPLE